MGFRDLLNATVTPRAPRSVVFVPKCGALMIMLPGAGAPPLRLYIVCSFGNDGVCTRCKRHRDGA